MRKGKIREQNNGKNRGRKRGGKILIHKNGKNIENAFVGNR